MLKNLWHKILHLGINEEGLSRSEYHTRVFNQLAILLLIALLPPTFFATFNGEPPDFIIPASYAIICIGLGLSYYEYPTLSKIFTFLCFSIVLSIYLLLFGMNYAISFGFVSLIALSLSFLDNHLDRMITAGIILLSYMATRIFLYLNEPILYRLDAPLRDDFILVIVSVISLVALWIYIAENKSQLDENKELLYELEDKNTSLKSAIKDLESFTYIASHDLKTPVRTVNSFLSLIKSRTSSSTDQELKEYVDYAKSGALKLNELITDILNYAKLDKDDRSRTELINLNDLLVEIKHLILSQDSYISSQVKSNMLPSIISHKTNFHQLFQNIIENGLKYNEEKVAKVRIESELRDSHLHIRFKDNGIGISEEYQHQIFDPFKRLHTDELYEGTGIGLAICKRITESMKGEILIQSKPNQGSTLSIILPVKQGFINGQIVYKTM